MCGILARVGGAPGERRRRAALDALRHRGPDDEGSWTSADGRVWLGHRRLSIVDLSDAGRQPFTSEDGACRLVCNGEIYNARRLRAALEERGHAFRSACDNEVVLHAYEEWGDRCVERLEGMFAFAIWDDRRRRMLAARDRVGIKPLYYSHDATGDPGLVIASEARAIAALDGAPAIDPLGPAYMLALGYVPAPLTPFKGVRKLEPGHLLVWEAGRVRTDRYWEPPRELDAGPAPGAFEALFETVVSEHLMADVPLGLFLSGGLDSSALAVALRRLDADVSAITVGFPDSGEDEAPLARAVADHLRMPHRVAALGAEDVDELLDETLAIFDEPQGYSALLSMVRLCRGAGVKAALAGDGGDELFGGYDWYRDLDAPFVPATARRSWFRKRPPDRHPAWGEMADFDGRSPLHRHALRVYPRFLPREIEAVLAPTGLRFDDEIMLEPLRRHFEPALPLRRALQRVDLMTFCSDSILAKVDRASMARGLEVRVPFLDHRLVEWAARRPVRDTEASEPKAELRDYVRGRVPGAVLDHPKQGFSLRALASYDWDGAIEAVARGALVRDGWAAPAWRSLVEPGVPFRKARIWNLLVLTRWVERHGAPAASGVTCASS